MKRTNWAIVAFISLSLLLGCQKDQPEKAQDPLNESYKLIDRGEYSQAINQLQQLSRSDARPQVRVTLASAYAARGGIKVEQYWGFVVGFKTPLVTPENVTVNSTVTSLQKIAKQLNGKIDPKDLQALGGVVNAVAVWDRYKDRIDAIPVVQGKELEDVRTAVVTLTDIRTPGGHLYRAILNLILFKSYVTSSDKYWKDFNRAIEEVLKGNILALCQFDFEFLQQWLMPIFYHLIETLNDLVIAYPDSSKELIEARNTLVFVQGVTNDAIKELRQKRVCP